MLRAVSKPVAVDLSSILGTSKDTRFQSPVQPNQQPNTKRRKRPMLPLPMPNYIPRDKPISNTHDQRPKISEAHKLPIPSEANVEEQEANDEISTSVDTCKATNKLLSLRVCRDRVLEGLEGCFGPREEIDAEEGGDERDDVCCAVEIDE